MQNLKEIAKKVRLSVIEMLYKAQSCHLGSNMSEVEILVALYFKILKPEDIFILSKGWGAAALYATLAEKGIIDKKDLLENYYTEKYPGLISDKVKGIVLSTGSAGHGIGVAVGMALANRNRKVYCLISDGECNCGTTWEAALFAHHHKLENLTVIIDYNKLQAFGKTNKVLQLEPFAHKWKSFGWWVAPVDGHNFDDLIWGFENHTVHKRPKAIIAHTIKGKGIPFAENKLEWHYYNLDEKLYEEAKRYICGDID